MSSKGLKPPILEAGSLMGAQSVSDIDDVHSSPEQLLSLQPISNSDDDQGSPECLLSLQPVGDDYSSDEKEKRNKSENFKIDGCSGSYHMVTRSKSDLSKLNQSIIDNSFRPSYVTHGIDFTEVENPTLAEYVEELLDFALEENTERRTFIDGKKLFDGKTTDKIIPFWIQYNPKIKWLFENFSDDIGMEFSPEDIIKKVKGAGVKKERISMEESKEVLLQDQCFEFVNSFLELLKTLENYDAQSSRSSSPNELHDIFKHVVPLIANFFDIMHKGNGQCKLKMHITEVFKSDDQLHLAEKDHLLIAKPDSVLQSGDEALMFPVEVYAPIASKDVGIAGDLNSYQISRSNLKFNTQHMVQHVGLLFNKMAKLSASSKPLDSDNPHISVGMFLTRELIHFSKVTTTVRHASSFTKNLNYHETFSSLRSKAWIEGSLFPADEFKQEILKIMKNNAQENGLLVNKSRWHINLYKSVHRNALFIFLLQYFIGYKLFVQNNLEI